MSAITDNNDAIINVANEYISWDPNSYTKALVAEALEKKDIATLNKMLNTRLAFGTAGLRARMGPGYSSMNDLVVIQTSQGLAMYLEEQFGADVAHERGIAIGYDHRRFQGNHLSHPPRGCRPGAGAGHRPDRPRCCFSVVQTQPGRTRPPRCAGGFPAAPAPSGA